MKRKQSVRSILTIGDGNLSYSLSLAALHTAQDENIELTATTYDTVDELKTKYGDTKIEETIKALLSHNARVLHGIDATKLSSSPSLKDKKFDLIVFMHPLVPESERYEFIKSRGDHFATVIINRLMITNFLRSAQRLLSESDQSEIHITMKNVYPYSWWRLDSLYQLAPPLKYLGSAPSDTSSLVHYESRNVDRDSPFPLTDSLTFSFGFKTVPEVELARPGKAKCEVCAARFSGLGDKAKHDKSQKHKKRVDLEAAWSEFVATAQL